MSATWRIRERSTFAEVRRRGSRARSGPLALSWIPLAGDDPPKVAYAIGKAVGTAVVRNRVRRRLRWALDQLAGGLPSGAYLIRVSPGAASAPASVLRTHVAALVATVARRSATAQPDGGPVAHLVDDAASR